MSRQSNYVRERDELLKQLRTLRDGTERTWFNGHVQCGVWVATNGEPLFIVNTDDSAVQNWTPADFAFVGHYRQAFDHWLAGYEGDLPADLPASISYEGANA